MLLLGESQLSPSSKISIPWPGRGGKIKHWHAVIITDTRADCEGQGVYTYDPILHIHFCSLITTHVHVAHADRSRWLLLSTRSMPYLFAVHVALAAAAGRSLFLLVSVTVVAVESFMLIIVVVAVQVEC